MGVAPEGPPSLDRGSSKPVPESVIVFDWDDTLFPTTELLLDMLDNKVSIYEPLEQQCSPDHLRRRFTECADTLEQLLRVAGSCGKVLIVTLTSVSYMTLLKDTFLPQIGRLFEELGVEIVFAMHAAGAPEARAHKVTRSDEVLFWGAAKRDAVAGALSRHYSKSGGRVLRSVVSVGDSDHDRLGARSGTQKFAEAEGHPQEVCVKTLTLIHQPRAAEVLFEIRTLRRWLPLMVDFEETFDIEVTKIWDMTKPQVFERRHGAVPIAQRTSQYVALLGMFQDWLCEVMNA